MESKSIARRLDALQRIAAKNKPFEVKVLLTDGSAVVTDQSGALDLFRELGAHGKIDSFQTDNPVYSGWAQLLTVLLHPAENRNIADFE